MTRNVYQRRLQIEGFSLASLLEGAGVATDEKNRAQPRRGESVAACACCENFRREKCISPDCTEQFEVPYSE